MNENDDPEIRRLLKKSPPLLPPESFYRGVLEKIEPSSPVHWLSGYPARGLVTACVLVVIVLVTRETKRNQPELLQQAQYESIQEESKPAPPALLFPKSQAKPADVKPDSIPEAYFGQIRREIVSNARKMPMPAATPPSDSLDLAESPEVQSRIHRSITDHVGTPSPFEEVDEADRNDREFLARAKEEEKRSWRLQARDMGGVASQGSFSGNDNAGLKDQRVMIAQDTQEGVATNVGSFNYAPKGAAERSLGHGASTAGEWKGNSSGVKQAKRMTIAAPTDWQALWQEHIRGVLPPPPVPEVDFKKFMVVGIFEGTKPTAGYSVEIVDVLTLPGKVVVRYRPTHPPSGAMTAQVLTQPYHLRLIPKTALPVAFEKIERTIGY